MNKYTRSIFAMIFFATRVAHAESAWDECRSKEREQGVKQADCLNDIGVNAGKAMIQPRKLSQQKADARVGAAKKAIADILNDPASAQFKDIKYMPETGAVCGLFNGKNAMGGYTSFRPFAYSAGEKLITIDNSSRFAPEATVEKLKLLSEEIVASSTAKVLCGS